MADDRIRPVQYSAATTGTGPSNRAPESPSRLLPIRIVASATSTTAARTCSTITNRSCHRGDLRAEAHAGRTQRIRTGTDPRTGAGRSGSCSSQRTSNRTTGPSGHGQGSRSHLTSEHPGSGQDPRSLARPYSPAAFTNPCRLSLGDRTGNARVVAGHADRSQIIRFMNSKRRWTIAGWASTAIGAWMLVWGVSGLDEPGLPNRHLLYDAGYSKSLQAESIFLGVGLLMFGYLAFRHSRS